MVPTETGELTVNLIASFLSSCDNGILCACFSYTAIFFIYKAPLTLLLDSQLSKIALAGTSEDDLGCMSHVLRHRYLRALYCGPLSALSKPLQCVLIQLCGSWERSRERLRKRLCVLNVSSAFSLFCFLLLFFLPWIVNDLHVLLG